MDNLTEDDWKKIIKEEGCAYQQLGEVRSLYANTPPYLRVYISLLAKKDIEEWLMKEVNSLPNDISASQFKIQLAHSIPRAFDGEYRLKQGATKNEKMG